MGSFFLEVGPLASFDDGWYFACVSHTALGYGDVVLAKPWRSLGPICAINGLLTFGCFHGRSLPGSAKGLASQAIRARLTKR